MRSEAMELFNIHYEIHEFSQSAFTSICKSTIWKLRDCNTSAEFIDKVEEAVDRIDSLKDYTWRLYFAEKFVEKFDEIDELNNSIFYNVAELGRKLFVHDEKDYQGIVEKFLADSENDLFDLQIVIEGEC